VEYRGRAPGQGGFASEAEAENLLAFGCTMEGANLPNFVRTLTISKYYL